MTARLIQKCGCGGGDVVEDLDISSALQVLR
jgi:hypothetical protein